MNSSSIIETLQIFNLDESSPSERFILFYYFAFNKSNDQNLVAFLRSIVYQFCAIQGIPSQLETLYLKYKKLVPGRRRVPIPGSSELTKIFVDICHSSITHGYLLLDALDEIPHGQQRDQFLKLLRVLTGHEEKTTNPSTLSILVTSQRELDFDNGLLWDQGWENLVLGRSRVDEDIARFVDHELSTATKFAQLSFEDKSKIEEYIVEHALGV